MRFCNSVVPATRAFYHRGLLAAGACVEEWGVGGGNLLRGELRCYGLPIGTDVRVDGFSLTRARLTNGATHEATTGPVSTWRADLTGSLNHSLPPQSMLLAIFYNDQEKGHVHVCARRCL